MSMAFCASIDDLYSGIIDRVTAATDLSASWRGCQSRIRENWIRVGLHMSGLNYSTNDCIGPQLHALPMMLPMAGSLGNCRSLLPYGSVETSVPACYKPIARSNELTRLVTKPSARLSTQSLGLALRLSRGLSSPADRRSTRRSSRRLFLPTA